MSCKNLLIRKRKYKPYFYCKELKKEIILTECENCLNRILVKNKGIKKATNKQKQLEKNRYSIFTNDFNHCFYCGVAQNRLDLHEVWGGSNRKRSMLNGFVVPLCRSCHSNEKIILELRKALQKEYEKTHTRQQFIDIIGKSSL